MTAINSLHVLLDQGLPRDTAILFRSQSIDCQHVGEIGMSAATDFEILTWATVNGFVIVTLDSDFHAMLVALKTAKPSVVRVRIEGLNGVTLARLLSPILDQYPSELQIGCMLTIKRQKTTCRLLS